MKLHRATLAEIQRAAAEVCNIPVEGLLRERRAANPLKARRAAIMAARRHSGELEATIGRAFNMTQQGVSMSLRHARTSRAIMRRVAKIEERLGIEPMPIPDLPEDEPEPEPETWYGRRKTPLGKVGPITLDVIERLLQRQSVSFEATTASRVGWARKTLAPFGVKITTSIHAREWFLDKENKDRLRALMGAAA